MAGARIVTILPLAYAAIASYFILIPGDSTVARNGVSRLTCELAQFIPLIIIVARTVIFYLWGHAEKKNEDMIVEFKLLEGSEIALGA
jgi:hypothetical protein